MSNPSILIVDDEPRNFDVIEAFLNEYDYELNYASSGQEALKSLEIIEIDLILLDVMMPDMDGIEVCERIKAIPKYRPIPIIMVTALTAKEDLAKCLNAGAVDFISKPVHALELRARMQSMLSLKQQYDALQISLERQSVLEAEKRELLENRNIELEKQVYARTAALKVASDLITHNALHDPLTDLPNRRFLLDRIDQSIKRSQQLDSYNYAILFLDLDQFKVVNDSLGHIIGDQLLISIAEKLKAHLEDVYLVARFGGDEFVILLEYISNIDEVIKITEQILKAFQLPLILNGGEIFINVSIGIVLGNKNYHQAADLLRDSDLAMYKAKAQGSNSYKIFDTNMHNQAIKRLTLETDLRNEINRQEFIVYYQPIMDILNGDRLIGFEALVRWQHPTIGLVSPVDFVTIAEETGAIVALDSWMFYEACKQLAQWQAKYTSSPALKMSINLSVQNIRNPNLLTDIDRILAETGLDGRSISLEITESILIADIEKTIDLLTQIKARNIQVSIDDFGTGYSSLNYIHRLPVDYLKIDRSFINQMQEGSSNCQIVRTIIALSNQLGLAVVAEGIETLEQLQILRDLKCEFGQGYLFSKPLPVKEIEAKFMI
ncbi:EAL domain-containing response regulator [Pseudanabaena minima]|uniref:EAL domain-containing response regulator n=1 Tax=Pseudanabaena minima TaxID=890415 RepID=UPI003DA8B814